MHPIEHLRHVARATGAPPEEVLREAAVALAGFAADPIALVTACHRLVDRHAANGAIWWLCARTLNAPDPGDEAWRCFDEIAGDRTVAELGHALPDGARVVVVGWPERLGSALVRRGDLEVRVVDQDGYGGRFVRALEDADVAAVAVPPSGAGPAVATADLVLLDASAVGPDHLLATAGSWPVAALAATSQVPVWAAVGVGRVVPAALWPPLTRRLAGAATAPWDRDRDLVPLALVDRLVGGAGPEPVAEGLARCTTPPVPELRR